MYRYHVWTFCNAFQHCVMTGENVKRKKGKMAWFLGRTDDVGWVIHNQRALLKVKKWSRAFISLKRLYVYIHAFTAGTR